MPTLYQIVTIALFSAFIVHLLNKSGLRDKVIELSPLKLFSKLFDCDFCLSFWINVFVCIVLVIITANIALMVIPFLSTPITRILL